jgi:hypothetical protein
MDIDIGELEAGDELFEDGDVEPAEGPDEETEEP